MSPRHAAPAQQLVAMLSDDERIALATAPRGFLEDRGIRVTPLEDVPGSGICTCDGRFSQWPTPSIAYGPTPGTRREGFTLIHEFCHCVVRRNDDVLSALHDMDDDAGRIAEERVCHAFAGLILVPDHVIVQVLAGNRPEARHIRQLLAASAGSLKACAVRLAEHLPANRHVVIARPRRARYRQREKQVRLEC